MSEHVEHAMQSGEASDSLQEPIERYVEDVLGHLPPAVPGLHRVGDDLTAHLREAAEASGSAEEAVREMGPADETAAGYAEGLDLEPASLADRTGAFVVDTGLGAVLGALVLALNLNLRTEPNMVLAIVLATVFAALSLLYFPALEARYGQTVGKRIFGLCVAREDGRRAELWSTVVRRLPLFFEVFWLDALFAPFTDRKQRAFDIVAGTIVVRGIARGGRPAGWTLALVLWTLPPTALFLSGRMNVALPF